MPFSAWTVGWLSQSLKAMQCVRCVQAGGPALGKAAAKAAMHERNQHAVRREVGAAGVHVDDDLMPLRLKAGDLGVG